MAEPRAALSFDHLGSAYREEASERLAELEETLLELEDRPTDLELVGRAFRAMHTIKGSGAMFGFHDVEHFTHELETVFDQVRTGTLPVTPGLIGVALHAKDLLRSMVAGAGASGEAERAEVVGQLRAMGASGPGPDGGARSPAPPAPPATGQPLAATYRVRFKPARELLQDGTNPLYLLEELRELGRCEVVTHTRGVPTLDALAPEACYLWWDAVVTTDRGENAVRGVFIFVEGSGELKVELIDDGDLSDQGAGLKKLGEILVEREELGLQDLQAALASQKKLGQVLVEKGLVAPEVVEAAALEQQVVREAQGKREAASHEETSSIRVPAAKLDSLVDLVGELVIAQARLNQLAVERQDPELLGAAEVIERLSASLRDHTLDIRMVPIGTTFARFKRLVRDLSSELGKEIEFLTDGAETELDKTVIERLKDPLVHLIRNSCDHGIEAPAARLAAGKRARGTVHLSARTSGASVIIELRDDGRGLDAVAIRAKAEQRGLVEPGAVLSEQELFGLVFLPGFSTAKQISNLSGRGVGLDVVKRSIDALRATVELKSVAGQGTTLRLTLPLTLAIIEGLLVGVGEARYVLPMSLVEECVELTREDVALAHGNQFTQVRGQLVSYVRLRDWFGVAGEPPPIQQIAIASSEGVRFGVVVDRVIGQHQTVIKTLGRMYQDVEGLSGATILGDGAVALIVDLPSIVRAASTGRAEVPRS